MHLHSPTPGSAEETWQEIGRAHGGVPPPHLAELFGPHLQHERAPPPPPPPPAVPAPAPVPPPITAPATEAGPPGAGSGSGVPDLNEPVAEGDEE